MVVLVRWWRLFVRRHWHRRDDRVSRSQRRTAIRRSLVAAWLAAATAVFPSAALGDHTSAHKVAQPKFPIRAAFYYPWFPNAWTQGGIFPYTQFTPTRGYYSSGDPSVVRSQIAEMLRAKIRVGIASWWGQGHHTDSRVRGLLDASTFLGSVGGLKWTLYYEREGPSAPNPTVSQIQHDLRYIWLNYSRHNEYLRINRRPVLFVYNANDTTCEVVDRWEDANTTNQFFLVMKVFSGYRDCIRQPDSWHQYGTGGGDGWDLQLPHSAMIAPGFWHAREATPRMPRDLNAWSEDVRAMVNSGANWHLIVSYNEWGEGTIIEDSQEFGTTYLDVLTHDGLSS